MFMLYLYYYNVMLIDRMTEEVEGKSDTLTNGLTGSVLSRMLKEKYHLSVRKYASCLGVSRQPIDEFINDKRATLSADLQQKIEKFDKEWVIRSDENELSAEEILVIKLYRELKSRVSDVSPLNFATKMLVHVNGKD